MCLASAWVRVAPDRMARCTVAGLLGVAGMGESDARGARINVLSRWPTESAAEVSGEVIAA